MAEEEFIDRRQGSAATGSPLAAIGSPLAVVESPLAAVVESESQLGLAIVERG